MEEPGKTRAIIAHITLIGWIIALVQNNSDKNEDASFYIRQMLGIMIIGIGMQVISMIFVLIPVLGIIVALIGWVVLLGVVGAWIYSLISAINGTKEPTPFIGAYFQKWFASM